MSDRDRLKRLSRRGWAWEFLRRHPEYRSDFRKNRHDVVMAAKWGLLHFSDPAADAFKAAVFWRPEDCSEVLPLIISSDISVQSLPFTLDALSCQIHRAVQPEMRRQDILLAQEGRFVQLSIFGNGSIEGAHLVTAALDDPATIMARTASLRRLNDLLFCKTMRSSLYPPEGRAPRLINVLTALDGWLAKDTQRDIAVSMFGAERVQREWQDPRQNLRDQVRRAINYGQSLMRGGYRQFLRLTFARRIAARQRSNGGSLKPM